MNKYNNFEKKWRRNLDKLNRLKSAKTRREFSDIFGMKESSLTYILYKLEGSDKYKRFDIPKKDGGVRKICAPQAGFRCLQQSIADILSCAVNGGCREGVENSASHGNRLGCDIFTNAKAHKNKRYVFNIDIEEFYRTITFPRVRGFFISNDKFRFDPAVATLLAQISCNDEGLPQGSPSSPVISNLIGAILDYRLSRLAKKHGCTYTRYVDDISFSTNKRDFPSEIAEIDGMSGKWVPGKEVIGVFRRSGFRINQRKTRMDFKSSRQLVTGVVVNRRVSIPVEYRKKVRACVHSLVTTGRFYIEKNELNEMSEDEKRLSLQGMIGHIVHADRVAFGEEYGHKTAFCKIFRDFIFYTRFYSNNTPLIVCEGETDCIHLRSAIFAMSDRYPDLVDERGSGVRFFSHKGYDKRAKEKSQRNTLVNVIGMPSGGVGNLGNIIRGYKELYDKSVRTHPCCGRPVIVISDNDDAGSRLLSVVKSIKRIKNNIGRDEKCVPVFGNLFIVLIPRGELCGSDKPVDIERLYSDDVRRGWVGVNGIVSRKVVFANHVRGMVHKSPEIFSGFAPLLDVLAGIVRS